MTGIGSTYGAALYTLACEEGLCEVIFRQLAVLQEVFAAEPDFIRLLEAPNLPKSQRCRILDDSFRGKAEPYVLNFLKLLTEKGYVRQFSACAEAYRQFYNRDNGILPVTAVTAVPMTHQQQKALTARLQKITGKRIRLITKSDPHVLGGIRLDYDGKCVDGTVSHRLNTIRNILKNTAI